MAPRHDRFYYHSAVLYEERIYVFGGGKGSKRKSADLSVYHIEANAWTLLSRPEVLQLSLSGRAVFWGCGALVALS